MDRDAEEKACERIAAAQLRIARAVCREGMAARWHIDKAAKVLEDPKLVQRYFGPLDQEEAARHMQGLPALIEQLTAQDRRCAELWAKRHALVGCTVHAQEQGKLEELLRQFRISSRAYELLVRQQPKPILDEARHLLVHGSESQQSRRAESILRMTVREFVDLEEELATDLRVLDEARAELVAHCEEFARGEAASHPDAGAAAAFHALCGLRKAAEWFLPGRGYRFATYAQHWIDKAIGEKRTWGLK